MAQTQIHSYSDKYLQTVMWVAQYKDSSVLCEWDQDTKKENFFKDIQKDKLKSFHFVDGTRDIMFCADDGVFQVMPEKLLFAFPLCGEGLNYADGLIQYKDASTALVPPTGNAYSGFSISKYNMGWEVTKGNLKCKVIFTYEFDGVNKKAHGYFTVTLTFLDISKKVEWKQLL